MSRELPGVHKALQVLADCHRRGLWALTATATDSGAGLVCWRVAAHLVDRGLAVAVGMDLTLTPAGLALCRRVGIELSRDLAVRP